MSEQLFTTDLGFKIELEDGTVVSVIPTNGAPGGTTETDAAGKGSIAMDYSTGAHYVKATAGSGTDKWNIMATQDYVDAVAGGLSWREPVRVLDSATYANIAAAQVAMNAGNIDGVALADQDRVLLTDLTTGADNIYIVTGTPGAAATYTEDSNAETSGDATYVQEGSTYAGQTWTYNGTVWLQAGGASETELGFLRAFVGKSAAGSELPDYSSENYVTDNDSLEVAIGKLDGQAGAQATVSTNMQTELDDTQTGAGLAANGDYISPSGTNYIDGATSLADADELLDAAIAAVVPGEPQIDNASSDTTFTTIDTLACAGVLAAKYTVHMRLGANVVVWEVLASHNGGVSNSPVATTVDFTRYAKLRMGTIAGHAVRVILNGTNMELQVKDTAGTAVVNATVELIVEP